MEPIKTEQKSYSAAKDVFLNVSAIVALYTLVISLANLLFTIINTAFPKINAYYNYSSSNSISWPVATLIVFFPIFILVMWLLEKEYAKSPDRKNKGIHKWLTYITLFVSGVTIAADLITVIYYFIDGQEINTAFLLKVLVLLVIASMVFYYYISDLRDTFTPKSHIVWRVVTSVLVIGSIVWGFAVLGSPRTQRMYKYDEQKVSDLQNIDNQVRNYFSLNSALPGTLAEITTENDYMVLPKDPQTSESYEYTLIGQSAKAYELCATFNKASKDTDVSQPYANENTSWSHPEGHFCFKESIKLSDYPKVQENLR